MRPLAIALAAALLGLSLEHAAAQSASGTVGYSDNLCTLVSANPSFKKRTDGSVEFDHNGSPTLKIDYSFNCQDGTIQNIPFSRAFNGLILGVYYDWTITKTQTQPTVTYKAGTHTLVFKGIFQSTAPSGGWTYEESFWKTVIWPYWTGLANSKVADRNVQVWSKPVDAADALRLLPKYIPNHQRIVYPYKKLYPAFPKGTDGKDDKASKLPRPMIRIYYDGPTGVPVPAYQDGVEATNGTKPQYFASVYCLPGDGDSDMFNRPAIVSDAFDPSNNRSLWSLVNDKRYSALVAQYDKPTASGLNSPRAAGYDLFFVDYSQGGGNMLINSALFLKVVEWMHSRTNANIIIGGPSMGGQLPRLALLYSVPENNEANGAGVKGKDLAPRVKGYLGIDSPHQGASISGTIQQTIYSVAIDFNVKSALVLVNFFGFDKKNDAWSQWKELCVPAAHQMLYEHYYPSVDKSLTESHDGFYGHLKALGKNNLSLCDTLGWRKDVTLVSVAYSNFHRPLKALIATDSEVRGEFDASYVVSLAYRTFRAGGPVGSPGWQELTPGSTGNWYYSPYKKETGSEFLTTYAVMAGGGVIKKWYWPCADASFFSNPSNASICGQVPGFPSLSLTLADHQATETYSGTFIPIGSALNLDSKSFDVMNPPTLNEDAIRRYSPFDAVYYMRETYNSYQTFQGKSPRTWADDKRYEHIIFDDQVMSYTLAGLKFIEEAPSRKVMTLAPWSVGAGVLNLTGPANWLSVPRAIPIGNSPGAFDYRNMSVAAFPAQATDGNAQVYPGKFKNDPYPGLFLAQARMWGWSHMVLPKGFDGLTNTAPSNTQGINLRTKVNVNDFNFDGLDDVLSLGNIGKDEIIVGLSNGTGGFTDKYTNHPDFTRHARQPEVRVATGDFNGDYNTDIALVGGRGWSQIHLALGNGTGTFTFTSVSAPDFAYAFDTKGAIFMSGNFHGPGARDLAVLSGNTLVIASFNSQGALTVSKKSMIAPDGFQFWSMAANPRAKLLVADFNSDGRSDIALTGVKGWTTIPVAFSTGTGPFTFTNKSVPDFPGWAAETGARLQPMEINLDYKADIVATGVKGWQSIRSAISNGDGTFKVTSVAHPEFAGWSAYDGVKSLAYPADLKGP